MSAILRATTFRGSDQSFRDTLNAHGIKFNRHIQLSGAVMGSGVTIEIIISGGYGVLAVACLAWANSRKSREINISTKDDKVVWLKGYSAKDAEKILESARQFTAIDTKPLDDGRDVGDGRDRSL